MLAYNNNRVDNIAIMKLYLINFLSKNFFLSMKYKRNPKLKKIVFNRIFRDTKKFKNSEMNDTKIIPLFVDWPAFPSASILGSDDG